MKMAHEEYLRQRLKRKRIELENQNVEFRIFSAESNVKKEMIVSEIDSIEKQLEGETNV